MTNRQAYRLLIGDTVHSPTDGFQGVVARTARQEPKQTRLGKIFGDEPALRIGINFYYPPWGARGLKTVKVEHLERGPLPKRPCPNCGQWRRGTHWRNDCVKRGFAS